MEDLDKYPNQMTADEAKAFAAEKRWEPLTLTERAALQFANPILLMPIGVFHEAAEAALKRPVWTHEFARLDLLAAELGGSRQTPTLGEILEQIPADKATLVVYRD